MEKRGKNKFIISSALFEIFLLISLSFAISFLLSEEVGLVSGTPNALSTGGGARLISEQFDLGKEILLPDGITIGKEITKVDGKYFAKVVSDGRDNILGESIQLTPDDVGFLKLTPVNQYAAKGYNGVKIPFMDGLKLQNSPIWGHLTEGVLWAVAVVGVVQLVGNLAGFDKETTNSLSTAVAGGIIGGKLATGSIIKLTDAGKLFGVKASSFGIGAGVVIAAAIFVLTYKKEKKKIVDFQCLPWEPALGGASCEQCNKDTFRPCTEYRCKSLGQGCELLNSGTNGNELCTWVTKFDVESPTITPWTEPLKPNDAKYITDTSVRPPALGVKILGNKANGCLEAFTALEFGFTTNEPAQCKLDYNHTKGFDDMQYYVGGDNYYQYNHTQKMRLPGPDNAIGDLAPLLENDGSFSLYTRCRDANGNQNVDEYSVSFCVDQGPDTTPPRVESTSVISGSPVQYNVDSVPIEVYVNEPAECKWSTQSKAFADMENTMDCATSSYEVNAELLYTCSSQITGIKDREENTIYFRCKDQPEKADNERNVMVQSYPLVLKGSQPLTINSIGPNETIFGSTSSIKVDLEVETSNGANEGKAICSFSSSGVLGEFVPFFETNNYIHKQELNLVDGDYTYYIRCVDAGGNSVEDNVQFNVKVDNQAPKVTRVYRDDALKIVTNEDAECFYSLNSCNYALSDGLPLEYVSLDVKTKHFVDWKTGTSYYIRCTDRYGNEPDPDTCSVIARPTQI